MAEVLILTNSGLRNVLRRLRGWTVGDYRALILAADQWHRNFYCTFDIRASDISEATLKITKSLEDEDAELLEIDEWFQPSCPMPIDQPIVQVGGRVYFDS